MKDEMLVSYEPAGMPRLEVRLSHDTIWMTMQQMAAVFEVDRSVIGKHIRNIYKTGELVREATWAKIAQVRHEGRRKVTRFTELYNLDMIISVGYRVNSVRATRFRIWATSVLKEYLLKGVARNMELAKIKKELEEHENRLSGVEQGVETIIQTLLPPVKKSNRIGFHP
jgi:hypothetical protein